MHDIKTFTKTPLNKLKNLCIGDKIELLTYKKDRKITIIKKDLAIYNVIEDGFKYKVYRIRTSIETSSICRVS